MEWGIAEGGALGRVMAPSPPPLLWQPQGRARKPTVQVVLRGVRERWMWWLGERGLYH